MAFFMGINFVGAVFCLKNWAMENTQFSSAIRRHHMYKEVCEQYRFCV